MIRLYLIKVRDGDAPASAAFGDTSIGSASTPISVTIKNERPARDPAAVVAAVRATGDFSVVPGSACEAGAKFAGQSSCVVNIVFAPKAKGPRTGKLEFLFAPTPGLAPQRRITALSGTGVAR